MTSRNDRGRIDPQYRIEKGPKNMDDLFWYKDFHGMMAEKEDDVETITNHDFVIELNALLEKYSGNDIHNIVIGSVCPSDKTIELILDGKTTWLKYKKFLMNLPDKVFKQCIRTFDTNRWQSQDNNLQQKLWHKIIYDDELAIRIANVNDTMISCSEHSAEETMELVKKYGMMGK